LENTKPTPLGVRRQELTSLRLLPAAVVALWFAERAVRAVVPWMGPARGAWASAMRMSASPAARRSAMEARENSGSESEIWSASRW